MSDTPIITVTPTIMSGTVVRWHHDTASQPCLSASREGVMIHGDQWIAGPRELPNQWIVDAHGAHSDLRAGRDVRHLATHKRKGLIGPIEPIVPEPAR